MTEAASNRAYSDDDFKKVLATIEEHEAKKEEVMASARGTASGYARLIANEIKTAAKLGISKDLLNAVRRNRKLEQQIADNAANLPSDLIELFEEASGQFSMFPTEEGEERSNVVTLVTKKLAADQKAAFAAAAERDAELRKKLNGE